MRRSITVIAAAVPLCLLVNAGVSVVADRTSPPGVRLGPAERCPAALSVVDAKNDTRSWLTPAPPGLEIPASADLRRLEVLATASGVCVRWITAAPAPSGTILVFFALGPIIRLPGGGGLHPGYGVNLELREKSAFATFGLDRTGRETKRNVLRVRAGRTGSVVSVFIPRAELDRPTDNFGNHPPFPHRAFTFEARVLGPPDFDDHRGADFWPQERAGEAGYINGHLCGPPCLDPRFVLHPEWLPPRGAAGA